MKTWAERIADLEAAGWSLKQIADDIDSSQQAVSELKQGRSKAPRGMAAVHLHALHKRVCGASTKAKAA
jgi:transcriptional regulator with XRE-family HTH domain